MQLLIKTFHGLEPLLAKELEALGATQVELLSRAVRCVGDMRLMYRANLELRTALRVFVPIYSFKTKHENHFYRKLREFNWSSILSLDTTFAIDTITSSRYLRHSKYVALKAKDAIVDQFRDKFGERPSIDVRTPAVRLHVHISSDNLCTVSLDSSGESLHKRGYRKEKVQAPINEVLAAGMVLHSGWELDCPFIDPMCGSGTIPIEAALYAHNIPPLWLRKNFGFQNWKDFDAELWTDVRDTAMAGIRDFEHPIMGTDKDFEAFKASTTNVEAAELEDKVELAWKDFESLELDFEKGILVMNPPYDERLTTEEVGAYYKGIGDLFKKNYSGYTAWMISSNREGLKRVGLRATRKVVLFNGALECRFQKYEMYSGTRKKDFSKKA